MTSPAQSAVEADENLVSAAIARLRAELEAATSDVSRAVLQHEIGVLEESAGDEAAAARDQLAAVNAVNDFREPLERLIAIIQRRQSHKNLGKLFDRLSKVADGGAERARALVEVAALHLDGEGGVPAAEHALDEALATEPSDGTAWLLREILAGKSGDDGARLRALSRRAGLAQDSTWQALLWQGVAELARAAGQQDEAFAAAERAVALGGTATWTSLGVLERLATAEDRPEIAARALEAEAALVLAAIADGLAGDASGVPRAERTATRAADCWLRAADAHRRRGDVAAAVGLLERALTQLPGDPALLHARLGAAEATGDTTVAANVARGELERGLGGAVGAALWLRVAEASAADGDAVGAYDAVTRALAEDKGSIPARALALDLLSGGHDAAALATLLEATAEELATEAAKARYYLAAADAWARLGRDVDGAKAALSQAGMYGAGAPVVARTARLLAALLEDAPWYDESTRRLTQSSEAESASLWFEVARGRLLRGERNAAELAVGALAGTSKGKRLAEWLAAFVLPALPRQPQSEGPGSLGARLDTLDALRALAATEDDPGSQRALTVLAARRARARGDHATAVELLTDLHDRGSDDLVVASVLAGVLRSEGRPADAARVLAATAAATDDATLAGALHLEAGLGAWHAGERDTALACFEAGTTATPVAAGRLLAWGLRAARPDAPEARRRVLDAAGPDDDPDVVALERFALESGAAGEPSSALSAIDDLRPSDPALALAAQLAIALSPAADASRLGDALRELADGAPALAPLAAGATHLSTLRAGGDVVASASHWASVDVASVPAALEVFARTASDTDRAAEVAARATLGARLPGELGGAVSASAALLSWLDTDALPAACAGHSAAERLVNLELGGPGSDPRRRADALAGSDAVAADQVPVAASLSGWSLLASFEVEAAMAAFRAATEAFPSDVPSWEGLRAAAEGAGDRATVAEACAALGDACAEATRGAEYWEKAAIVLLDELADPARGEFALARAVERDVSRGVAFDRLFRVVRARKDGPRLLELISARLEVAEDPEEIAKLFWERARVLRAAGDRAGALAALENVTELEPNHVGALALSGEIYITTGQFAEAAENLARLASLDEAPVQQRLISGVAAVDLYENKLGELQKGLAVLMALHRSGHSTLPVRERLARAAAKLEAWDVATGVLEELMNERAESDGRAEAARLALVIHRDSRARPADAAAAAERLLTEIPGDAEALDLVLAGVLPPDRAARLLRDGREVLVRAAMAEPLDAERVDRLSRVARAVDAPALRQATLGALVALGAGSTAIDHELGQLDQRVARLPQMAIDERALPDLCDPGDLGPIPALLAALATTLTEAIGPGLAAFGVGKKERVDPRAGLPLRNEVAAWAGALGLGDFDLYVGGSDPLGIAGIPLEVPAIVVGAGVTAPLSAAHRGALAREMFALRRGVTVLRHREANDVAAIVVAAVRLAGFEVPSPQYAMLAEFQRALGKEMSRKVKKLLPELAAPVAQSGQDPVAWVGAATASLDRLAAIAAGDVSTVLAVGGARGQLGASREARARAARLLTFVLSPSYLALRDRLGMGVR